MQFYDPKTSTAEERRYRISMQGTGNGTVPKKLFGQGITLSWTATGRILLTWAYNPGTFVGIGGRGFRDATQTNVKGFTCTGGAWPATANTYTLEIDVWNASAAAADLATTSFLELEVIFAASSVAQ